MAGNEQLPREPADGIEVRPDRAIEFLDAEVQRDEPVTLIEPDRCTDEASIDINDMGLQHDNTHQLLKSRRLSRNKMRMGGVDFQCVGRQHILMRPCWSRVVSAGRRSEWVPYGGVCISILLQVVNIDDKDE
jgi:hypothetical protein